MRNIIFILILSVFSITGCAGGRAAAPTNEEYVEIDNPAFTMSPNAPATIWVPRSYVESGVPRGGDLVKKGYEAAKGSLAGSDQVQMRPSVAAVAPLSAAPVPVVKNRIAVLEVGKNALLAQFQDMLKKISPVIVLDPSQTAMLARYAAIGTQAERSAFAVRLQEDYSANQILFVNAPDGIAPGKTVQVEIYDAMGGGLVRSVEAAFPQYESSNIAARDAAVSATLLRVVDQAKEVLSLLPWYGKVVAVEGSRVYINAGKEAGIQTGQVMKVYRGGKVVQGLGFAPGNLAGTIEISGYVGTNGSYGNVREGAGIQVSDLVAAE